MVRSGHARWAIDGGVIFFIFSSYNLQEWLKMAIASANQLPSMVGIFIVLYKSVYKCECPAASESSSRVGRFCG
jgi:hypothetical protein